MKSHLYVIGSDPYYTRSESHTKGNGQWSTTAANVKEALRVIFGSMQFPAEASGRSSYGERGFIPGVSIEGKNGHEVIQVWSTEPKAVANMPKDIEHPPHDGNGRDMGLLMELDVTKLDEYLTPIEALLTGPEGSEVTALSPLGASVIRFEQQKTAIQKRIQMSQFEVQQRKWSCQELEQTMREQVKGLEEQIEVVNTYLHGTRHRTMISTGKSGSGPYHIFQERQMLDTEVALLGNFQDFDFQDLPALEKWLVEKGKICKMLPYERCILVTRIRGSEKNYHCGPLENALRNIPNMVNMIWIRDGENVCHVDVEFDFDNAVFPAKDQFDRTFEEWRQIIWKKFFSPHGQDKHRWMYDRQVDPPMGQLKPFEPADPTDSFSKNHYPEDEREPYTEVRLYKHRFDTLEEWIESSEYTEGVEAQIRGSVQDYLRSKNKENMKFCVLLQGIVDHTSLLQIPKGTDLFNWESVSKFIVLVHDYSHGLPDRTYSGKLAEYLDPSKVKAGDWVIVYLDEGVRGHSSYSDNKEPWLFYVTSMKEVVDPAASATHKSGNLTVISKKDDTSGKFPVVYYRPRRQRGRDWNDEGPMANRLAEAKRVLLNIKRKDNKYFRVKSIIRVPFPSDLAEKILDDREWKSSNREHVTLMAQYRYVMATYLKNPVNQTRIEFKHRS